MSSYTACAKINHSESIGKNKEIPTKTQKIPRKYWIFGSLLAVSILTYSLIFFIPKKIEFSYAGESCSPQLILFPGAQTIKSESYSLDIKDELKIGSFAYATTKVCASPKESPEVGKYTASVGLFGGWFTATV